MGNVTFVMFEPRSRALISINSVDFPILKAFPTSARRPAIKRKAEQLLSIIRVLVADDFERWRRQVRLLLRVRPELQVICEASDGSEAVQKADDLKPDLIVLDIGLPKLNGIEAARRIRQLSTGSKILFLSQNNDPDIVQAALDTGALGYIHKTSAREELLPAVEAVLQGNQFVSNSLKTKN